MTTEQSSKTQSLIERLREWKDRAGDCYWAADLFAEASQALQDQQREIERLTAELRKNKDLEIFWEHIRAMRKTHG